ncbi:uncharacterized protein Eint_010250 [Encephalitozoon intestinalis ATCC 50506]|uniref:Uncharacterized protein n=1 Tax=Encephalitozoon intestinalis (strain ATCC 50506) TaxID=876142 RepID=E0S5A4_ENCIT|nr:uncharacterized protein Eint_010250 [Encephalitozoon intestinalis ATCC 50506]ADM10889.1 hypothetical protein Eint_010250 [Encephalitozoon intestinalis ATCC 50506]UTX44521.1 putative DMAP1-like protein [Encephalitozoon intestinalis]
MGKKENGQDYEFCESSTIQKYCEILNNIESIRRDRDDVLSTHFNEVCTYNISDLEDRAAVIRRLINKELVYPNAFLASSLGFNKTTWNRDYEKTLREIGMYKRPKYSTLKNMLLFEKLKWLIIRYHEAKQKKKKQ